MHRQHNSLAETTPELVRLICVFVYGKVPSSSVFSRVFDKILYSSYDYNAYRRPSSFTLALQSLTLYTFTNFEIQIRFITWAAQCEIRSVCACHPILARAPTIRQAKVSIALCTRFIELCLFETRWAHGRVFCYTLFARANKTRVCDRFRWSCVREKVYFLEL